MLFIKILVVLLCLGIFWEDLKTRAVHWYLFPAVAGTLFYLSYKQSGIESVWNLTYNLVFIVLQLFALTAYFSIKFVRPVNIFKNFIGAGDVLFFIAVACYLPLVNFVIFYIISLIIVLLLWTFFKVISRLKSEYIPLAGLQAMLFAVILGIQMFSPAFNLANDSWVLDKLAI